MEVKLPVHSVDALLAMVDMSIIMNIMYRNKFTTMNYLTNDNSNAVMTLESSISNYDCDSKVRMSKVHPQG